MISPSVSEKEAVLRERAAFRLGAAWGPGWHATGVEAEAAKRYPLPKISRPRVVRFRSSAQPSEFVLALSLRDGALCYRYERGEAERTRTDWHDVTTRRGWFRTDFHTDFQFLLDGYADLKASPTELVDDDSAGLSEGSQQ